MKNISTIIAFILSFSITTTAQETSMLSPRPSKQFGLRLNKERYGTGLSAQLELAISENKKWYIATHLGITLAHPIYDLFDFRGQYSPFWGLQNKVKLIDIKINYLLGVNYHLGLKWLANTHRKVSPFVSFNLMINAGEMSSGMDTDYFYEKYYEFVFSIVPYPAFGIQFKLNNALNLSTDISVAWLVETNGLYSTLGYNAGLALLWNWK